MSKKNFLKLFLVLFCALISLLLMFFLFYPIFISNNIIIKFALVPFNICTKHPSFWKFFKIFFIVLYIFSNFIIFNSLFSIILKKFKFSKKNNSSNIPPGLNLVLGTNLEKEPIFISEKGLFQNILITGSIGSGKTSSAMYPFTSQFISYNHNIEGKKLGMLILDVKGNFYKKVQEYCSSYDRSSDLIIFGFNNNIKYNPLDKPSLKASVLADRIKTILMLFSTNNQDSYWLDKAQEYLTECIKLCRIYNNNYVTFLELHKLVNYPDYYYEKLNFIKTLFQEGKLSKEDSYNLLSAINFFDSEYKCLDSRVLSIIKSEITRITSTFINDLDVLEMFCPKKEDITFTGFRDVINKGKIVVLSLNIYEYRNLSRIIAAYLKLDFQSEVISSLAKKDSSILRPTVFLSDEFQEYASISDSEFFSQSREAKCINIVATQSYTSLLNSLKDQASVKVIIQNLVNKLWFRTDDSFTIEEAQKQIGKELKLRTSINISENSKETKYDYFINKLKSSNSNISESLNSFEQNDYIFDSNYFSQNLETFSCLSFLSDGHKISKPCKILLQPCFSQSNNLPDSKYQIIKKELNL